MNGFLQLSSGQNAKLQNSVMANTTLMLGLTLTPSYAIVRLAKPYYSCFRQMTLGKDLSKMYKLHLTKSRN